MCEKINKILMIIFSIIIMTILIIFYLPNLTPTERYRIGELTQWECVHQDGNTELINLPEKLYKKGETQIAIHTTLPTEFNSRQTICFWTYFQDAKAYLNDEMIYESGQEMFGKASVSRWNYLEIPARSEGKKLTIFLSTPYDKN
ncbi:MAG: hypothetical protein U0L05_00015 [Schaedlerella sp.]|nr:hypothetical protein [Schaedlerella sp.]